MGYHESKTPEQEKDSWSTPQWLFDWANSIWRFDIDLAANKGNAKLGNYFTEKDNALDQDWMCADYTCPVNVGWCNPPYSSVKPWIVKSIEEARSGFTTVMLIPTPNGETKYEGIFKFASKIIFIEGRIAFIGHDGKPKSGNNRGSCIVVFDKYSCTGDIKGPAISYIRRDEIKEMYSGNS